MSLFYKEGGSLKIVAHYKDALLPKKKPFSSDNIDYMLEVNSERENQQPDVVQSPEFMHTPLLFNEKSAFPKTPSLFNNSSEIWQSKPDLSTNGHTPKNQYTASNSLSETVSYYQSPGLFEDKICSAAKKTLKKSRTIEGNVMELGDIAEQKSMEDVLSPKKHEKQALNKEFQILFDINEDDAPTGKQEDYNEDSCALGNEEEDFRLLNTIFPTKKQVLVLPLQQQSFFERKTLKIDTMKLNDVVFKTGKGFFSDEKNSA